MIAKKIIGLYESLNKSSLYLVAAFEGKDDLKNNHMTVTYFGKRSNSERKQIQKVIESSLNSVPISNAVIKFTKEEMFGPDKDIRVLTPTDDMSSLFENLRKDLYEYNASQFKDSYKPHVTTNEKTYEGEIDRLVLCESEYAIISEYKLKKGFKENAIARIRNIAKTTTSIDGKCPHTHEFKVDINGDGDTNFTSDNCKDHFHKIIGFNVLQAGVDGHTHSIKVK